MAVTIEERPHATLGPSGWDRWGACPGSVLLTEHLPYSSSGYADEGTAAHQLLEDCLQSGLGAEDLLGREYIVNGNLYVVDMDMADAVNTALAWVAEEIDEVRGDILMSEQQVPIAHLTGETDAEGSADVIGIVDGGKTLVVMDYKHGKGVQVYATEKLDSEAYERGEKPQPNGQLAMYGLGSLHMLAPLYDEIEKVKLVIMQPRLDWRDDVTLTVAELRAFGDKVTLAAGKVELNRDLAAQGLLIDLVPTDKGCKFCKAKHTCPALSGLTSNALSIASSAADFDDLTLPKKAASVVVDESISTEKLAEAMRAAPLIEDFIKAVRAEVERRLFAGEEVPGFYIGEGKKGNRAWLDKEEAALELTKSGRLKVDEAFDKVVISPTKAEKLLKDRPKIWSKIAPLIGQSEGKPSVCKVGDKNPPYLLGSTAEAFEDLTAAPESAAVEAPKAEPDYDPFA
jgi:hypothetical protein